MTNVITREKAIGLYLPIKRSDYLHLAPFIYKNIESEL